MKTLYAYLERVRAYPKEKRRRVALYWSCGITGVIVLGWLAVILGTGYATRPQSAEEESSTADFIQDLRTQFEASNQFRAEDFTLPNIEEKVNTFLEEALQATTSTTGEAASETEAPISAEANQGAGARDGDETVTTSEDGAPDHTPEVDIAPPNTPAAEVPNWP